MKQLSAFPTGLLDLVGDMDMGRNLNFLNEDIRAVVDMTPHYLVAKQSVVPRSSTPFGAPGFHTNGQITVPSGEIWLVHAWSLGMFTAAGEAAAGLLMAIVDGTGIALGDLVTVGASSSGFTRLANPFWARSGDRLGLWINSLTGAPTYSGGLLVSRMRA